MNLAETEQDQFLFLPFSPLFFSHCLNFVENKKKLNNTRGVIIAWIVTAAIHEVLINNEMDVEFVNYFK